MCGYSSQLLPLRILATHSLRGCRAWVPLGNKESVLSRSKHSAPPNEKGMESLVGSGPDHAVLPKGQWIVAVMTHMNKYLRGSDFMTPCFMHVVGRQYTNCVIVAPHFEEMHSLISATKDSHHVTIATSSC
eukprot:2763263-Amphidinium_carterae.4